jgi:POT family proton-dependent oligopeptide transporter
MPPIAVGSSDILAASPRSFTEMWERFSYYGLRPLLIPFMTAALADGGFGFARLQASAIVGIYAASVYLASLPGGWIADRLLGLRRAILTGAFLIASGHLSIGIRIVGGKVLFFLGSAHRARHRTLPNISAIVGDLYPESGARRDAGFSIFYMGINTGSFLGQIVTGALGERVGWHWGFGAAGVGMLIGLTVFATRASKTLGNLGLETTKHPDPVVQAKQIRTTKVGIAVGLGALALVIALAASGTITLNPQAIGRSMTYVLVGLGVAYFGYIHGRGPNERRAETHGRDTRAFVFSAIFWSAFEQAPTSLNLFARRLHRSTARRVHDSGDLFQSVNALFIIILAPVFAVIWSGLAKRGLDFSSPSKFAIDSCRRRGVSAHVVRVEHHRGQRRHR